MQAITFLYETHLGPMWILPGEVAVLPNRFVHYFVKTGAADQIYPFDAIPDDLCEHLQEWDPEDPSIEIAIVEETLERAVKPRKRRKKNANKTTARTE